MRGNKHYDLIAQTISAVGARHQDTSGGRDAIEDILATFMNELSASNPAFKRAYFSKIATKGWHDEGDIAACKRKQPGSSDRTDCAGGE